MQEVFFFYARGKARASSRRIGVFFASFLFSFTPFLLFLGGTPCGERGVHRDVQRGTGDFPGVFWEVGVLRGRVARPRRTLSFSHYVDVDTNRKNFESDLTRREQRDLLILFIFFFDGSVVC